MKSTRKLRRTFTLSPKNVAYIEQQTLQKRFPSHSAFLDDLLREKTDEQTLKDYAAQVTAYYDNLTDAEVEEDRVWGEFAGSHLVLSKEELAHAQSAARRDLVHENADRSPGKRKASSNHRLHQSAKRSSAS